MTIRKGRVGEKGDKADQQLPGGVVAAAASVHPGAHARIFRCCGMAKRGKWRTAHTHMQVTSTCGRAMEGRVSVLGV